MKIEFDNLKTILDCFNSVNDKDTELEFKIGTKNQNFESSITENEFSILKRHFNYINPEFAEKDIYLYPNNYRSINGNFEIKEKTKSVDINVQPYCIRFTKSYEKPVTSCLLECIHKRKKKTWIYNFVNYNIELSIVNEKKFECEIEYKIFNITTREIFTPINEIIDVLSNYTRVLKSFNNIFGFKGSNLYFPINKPRNIKKTDCTDIKKTHVCFDKKDGVRYLLYKSKHGTYLINKTHLIEVDGIISEKVSVLDCEYYDGDFVVFDILVHDDKSVIDLKFNKRYNLVKKHNYKLLKYRKPSHKTIESIMDDKNNDGVIFTPIDCSYKNNDTLKFKSSEQLTIDFLYRDEKLYVTGNDGLISMDYKSDIPKEMTNKIIECKYVSGVFVPFRIRQDKTVPNYIDVCKDIMTDILDPISIKDIV